MTRVNFPKSLKPEDLADGYMQSFMGPLHWIIDTLIDKRIIVPKYPKQGEQVATLEIKTEASDGKVTTDIVTRTVTQTKTGVDDKHCLFGAILEKKEHQIKHFQDLLGPLRNVQYIYQKDPIKDSHTHISVTVEGHLAIVEGSTGEVI